MIVYGTVPTSASNTSAPVNLVSLYGPSGGVAIDQIYGSSNQCPADSVPNTL